MDKEAINFRKWSLIFSGVLTIATVIYAGLTLTIFFEIQETNDLTKLKQNATLRPYVNNQVIDVLFKDGGTADELWNILSVNTNAGDLSATETEIYGWIDYNEDIVVNTKPENLSIYFISPILGSATHSFTKARKEILNILAENKEAYIHYIIWYKDALKNEYTSRFSYRIDYVEGERLDTVPIFIEIK